ncbi:MAG: glycosyltransferase family 4 protein, partial [bacterium]|nr:glycosyltransferase family 4 protein [bacterium]
AALRRQAQLAVLGPDAPVESDVALDDEIALARRASAIWAVSSAEAELLGSAEVPASVIAHGEQAEPGESPFEERRGILFVGRLDEPWNPNVDGLRWFLEEIHPLIVERLGETPVTVAGEPGDDVALPRPEGVHFAGRVEDLAPLYDRHRLFVAPTRFAAGIPTKITKAAAHGLPVVATSLLAGQLDWRHGTELLDGGDNDAERFAEQVVELHDDAELWSELRRGALERVRREYSRDALRHAVVEALGLDEVPEEGWPE